MGRPAGSKNRQGAQKPGRKTGQVRLKSLQMTDGEIMDAKYAILKALSAGQARTISEAARLINIDPVKVYFWGESDPDFRDAVKSIRQVIADELEDKLNESKNFIPWMFLLKAYRPEYKDKYVFDTNSGNMEKLLNEIREAGKKKEEPLPAKEVYITEES